MGIWTGSQFVIWGGNLGPNRNADTGAAYEPQADRWVGVSATDAPTARASHATVWTGQEKIVWGGINSGGYPMTGGRYDPTRTTWRRLSEAGAPAGRIEAAAAGGYGVVTVWRIED